MLHPLPRVNEISIDVDANKKAWYFQQALNGVLCQTSNINLNFRSKMKQTLEVKALENGTVIDHYPVKKPF